MMAAPIKKQNEDRSVLVRELQPSLFSWGLPLIVMIDDTPVAPSAPTFDEYVRGLKTNSDKRSDYIRDLLNKNRAIVLHLVRNRFGSAAHQHKDDAFQSYLMKANAAVLSFRSMDDGRGRNSLDGWCEFRAMNAVREYARTVNGRLDQPNKKLQFSRAVVALTTSETGKRTRREMRAEFTHSDSRVCPDTAEYVVADMEVSGFIASLPPIEQRICSVLAYGAENLTCHCGTGRHSFGRDIAIALDMTEDAVDGAMNRIRDRARRALRA